MDESTQWILSLSAIGLWFVAVWALYFFVLKKDIEHYKNYSRADLGEIFKTRRQRYLETINKNKDRS